MSLLLTLDAALDGCSAGLVQDGTVVVERRQPGGRGSSAALPSLVQAALDQAGVAAGTLDGIVVTVGPGSFTGVRAALALAQGIALGAGIPVLGVSVTAALRAGATTRRLVWVAIDSKRGRVFLDDAVSIATVALDALPAPSTPIAVAGDAAIPVASRLAARGFDVQLLPGRLPRAQHIAAAPRVRPLPLYVDPPEARPGPGARPAPA